MEIEVGNMKYSLFPAVERICDFTCYVILSTMRSNLIVNIFGAYFQLNSLKRTKISCPRDKVFSTTHSFVFYLRTRLELSSPHRARSSITGLMAFCDLISQSLTMKTEIRIQEYENEISDLHETGTMNCSDDASHRRRSV